MARGLVREQGDRKFERDLNKLTDLAVNRFQTIIGRIPAGTSVSQSRELTIEAVYQLADVYGGSAASSAVRYIGSMRGPNGEPAKPIRNLDREQVRRAVLNITGDLVTGQLPEGMRTRVEALLVKLVRIPGHETIKEAVRWSNTRYARKPNPGACSWCMMLVSRGAVYSRQASEQGSEYHDGCRCTFVEIVDNDDYPALVNAVIKAWDDGLFNDKTTTRELYKTLADRPSDIPTEFIDEALANLYVNGRPNSDAA